MGLLTKEVEITLNSRNIKHFEECGYHIPKHLNGDYRYGVERGTKITVNIEDVTKGSPTKILIQCDECGDIYPSNYRSYNNRKTEKCYCHKCYTKLFHSNENHHNWNPNISDEDRQYSRHTQEYTDFVKNVIARDNYTCYCCESRNGDLEVHHLDGMNWNKDGVYDYKNVVTLCKTCHKNFHSIYGLGNNTKVQFEEWINHAVGNLDGYNGVLPTARQVICYETQEIFNSSYDAANSIGCTHYLIRNCCNKKERTNNKGWTTKSKTAKGKHYFWLDEYKKMTPKDFEEYFEWCKRTYMKRTI